MTPTTSARLITLEHRARSLAALSLLALTRLATVERRGPVERRAPDAQARVRPIARRGAPSDQELRWARARCGWRWS